MEKGEMAMERYLSFADIKKMLGERPADSHKGKNGRGLLLAGSPGFGGAAVMASAAALRGGVGTLKVLCPEAIRPAFSVLPEAMVQTFPGGWDALPPERLQSMLRDADCVAAGPGIGKRDGVWQAIRTVLSHKKKTVLDADALNVLSCTENAMDALHPDVILTPHIGEMARLTGLTSKAIAADMPACATHYAKEWGCTVLLKSAQSVIAASSGQYRINRTGNAGLAKGGSGDVLTGITLSMLGQGLPPFEAACAGAYLLGASADEAVTILKERMLMAGDVIGMVEQTVGRTRL
ncbi:MAG: NAD(P)H-hydrate dehydratase [Clostridia bacterium]|nr:NAD(P)H-hydrate dehydratase [Clostridia bacterium]